MASTATAQSIIESSLQELGLPLPPSVVTADDQISFQALGLLNALGDELVRLHDWQFLEEAYTFLGDGVTTEFPIPSNFGRIVNQTQWSATDKRPMTGPLSAQQWGWCQYGIVSVGVFFRYRILGNKFAMFPAPGPGTELAFFYISRNWVQDGVVPATFKDRITNPSDVPQFDRRLLVCGLKVKLWAAKGFDTTSLMGEWTTMLEVEKSQNQGASVISLGRSSNFFLIDGRNIPDGNWITS